MEVMSGSRRPNDKGRDIMFPLCSWHGTENAKLSVTQMFEVRFQPVLVLSWNNKSLTASLWWRSDTLMCDDSCLEFVPAN